MTLELIEPKNENRVSPYVTGAARFSFITPECIRMEYAPGGSFINSPSLFATARPLDSVPYDVRAEDGWTILRTSLLELRYLEDGRPFHSDNLRISRRGDPGKGGFKWQPGMEQRTNLKGPLQTLDGVRGPTPLPDGLLSRDGWFVYDDSRGHLLVNGWITQRKALPDTTIEPSSYKVRYRQDWYFFGYGIDYQAGLDALMKVCGKVPVPRKATLGTWFCRWYPYNSGDYRQIARDFQAHDLPLDVMVLDMDWHRLDATTGTGMQNLTLGWNGYSWNRDLLPDAEALLAELKSRGLTVCLNDHPHDGIRHHEDCYAAFMEEMGPSSGMEELPFKAGDQRYWEAFWKHSHCPKEEDGVDFWWLDWQQDDVMPFVPGMGKLPHLPWLNALYFRESQREGKRGQGFSRWGGLGDHKHPIHFSGDIESNWEAFKFEVEFTVRSSNSGCYFWSHDIGGFYGKPDAELYARWMQFGAFSAALRLHSSGDMDRRPWTWDSPYREAMKAAMQLRTELMPYVYTAAWQCWSQNKPLLRPMYLEWPEEEAAYAHMGQYLFGDHLLVAPVTEKANPGTRLAPSSCWLPPGEWIDWWTGEIQSGNRVIKKDHPLERFPLYVRAGACIPVDRFSTRCANQNRDTLILLCFAPPEGESMTSWYYNDDGEGPLETVSAENLQIELTRRDGILHLARSESGQAGFDGPVELYDHNTGICLGRFESIAEFAGPVPLKQ